MTRKNLFTGRPKVDRKLKRKTSLPKRSDLKVTIWDERDRLRIRVTDDDTEQLDVANWWDDDARSMIKDGFFDNGNGFEVLEESILDYCQENGLIAP